MIEFDDIPPSIRKPGKYFEFNTKLAVRTLPGNAQKMLIVGERMAEGSVAALTPTKVFSDAEPAAYFGAGSMAQLMVRAAIKANPYLDLTVIAPGAVVGGSPAHATVTITGSATGSGTLALTVGTSTVLVPISSGDDFDWVGIQSGFAVNGDTSLPVTPSYLGDSGVLTLTCKQNGTAGNLIPVTATCTAPGLTVVVTAMTGGTGVPDISSALAKVAAEQFDVICIPYTDSTNLTALKDHLDLVSGPMEQRPGVGVIAQTGALATATTLAGTINHGRITLGLLRGTASSPYEVVAAYAAVIAGEEDPARPLNTLELKGIKAPPIDQRLSRTEQESCLANGVTPLEVGPGEKVQIVRAITSYTVDAQGVDDISLLDLTTIRTLDYVRKACRERISLRFPREKLSSKTPPRVRTELLDVLRKLEDLEIVEEVQANKDGLIVERNGQDPNRLDAKIPTDVVNGLHVFAGRIDLLL